MLGNEAMDEELAREVELLKHKVAELEQLARGRGLVGMFNFWHAYSTRDRQVKNT